LKLIDDTLFQQQQTIMILARLFFTAIALIAAVLTWWLLAAFGTGPEHQMLIAQEKFVQALERRDWSTVQKTLTDDYMDEFGHDLQSAVDSGRQLLAHFYTLTITQDITKKLAVADSGMVHAHLRVQATGAGLSQTVLSKANGLTEPWVFHWHKKGKSPWSWKLVQIHHPQLSLMPRPLLE
jgi:hypothetical protein